MLNGAAEVYVMPAPLEVQADFVKCYPDATKAAFCLRMLLLQEACQNLKNKQDLQKVAASRPRGTIYLDALAAMNSKADIRLHQAVELVGKRTCKVLLSEQTSCITIAADWTSQLAKHSLEFFQVQLQWCVFLLAILTDSCSHA